MITLQREPKAILDYLRFRKKEGGYRYLRLKKGAHGSGSELEMHCRIVDKPARFALISPRYHYAYVVYEDGRVVDGLFTLYVDGNFCLH
jgi:hypothetical protein